METSKCTPQTIPKLTGCTWCGGNDHNRSKCRWPKIDLIRAMSKDTPGLCANYEALTAWTQSIPMSWLL